MKLNIRLADRLGLSEKSVAKVVELLESGCTIPFIARYRKELTGGLDEVQIANILDAKEQLDKLEQRRKTILTELKNQGVQDEKLLSSIQATLDLSELEDLYLPYKPKRKTKASVARENGLEPLAKMIMKQDDLSLASVSKRFINDACNSIDKVLEGAREIIAEWISERVKVRNIIRNSFERGAIIESKLKRGVKEAGNFEQYSDWKEPLRKCPSHRFLAILRGESEGVLSVKITCDIDYLTKKLEQVVIRSNNEASSQVALALKEALKKSLLPSFDKEFRNIQKEKADEEAIKVFAQNMRQLLLAAPLGNKRILGIDPGFRTGCKLVCVDETGALKHNETIYPHPPQKKSTEAIKKISQLVEAYKIDAIAIGNGTAGRETENLVKRMRFKKEVAVFVVNEAGASVYSASSIARKEFPDYDVTVRGAVSIARRLADPMAELVKIDPKSIGVGQYQHDVDQKRLETSLSREVSFCVNKVGVDVNTASAYLLKQVAGLNMTTAENLVKYREENGIFKSRKELLKVPRIGEKVFEQCAGFLRVKEANNPLDNSSVHPESYWVVDQLCRQLNIKRESIIGNEQLEELKEIEISGVGKETLSDIIQELKKPGRDPRSVAKVVEFDSSIKTISDLVEGSEYPGLVTNITNFGAFVDIGIKEGGLVHISEIREEFISNPADVLKLNQPVRVKVLSVDLMKKRVAFSMKGVKQPRYAF